MMRHVYIRGILALIWIAVGIVSVISGALGMAALYMIIGGVFLYSAYSVWRKENDEKGDR